MPQALPRDTAELLTTLEGIPPFPPIAIRLLQSLSDETIEVSELVELIRADPKLTAALVRRANSAAYGCVKEVDSVRDALVLLGFDTVRVMALTLAAGTYTQTVLKIPELRRCWTHSLATAVLAEELARSRSARPDQAYTAGLLHDLGRLGLLVAYPNEYADLLKEADSEGPKNDSTYLLDREQRRFGVDHCEAGLMLAEKWGFPEELTRIAGRHHDRCYGATADLLTIAHVACRLADTFEFDVIKTTRPFTLEDAQEVFPESDASTIWKEIEGLRQHVYEKINSLDESLGAAAGEGTLSPESSLPIASVQVSTETPVSKPAASLSTPSVTGSELPMMFAASAGAFLAAAFALFLWLTSS
ncbi:MAG: HDOD domain-containing protein [Acidobacteria bacterium]|nr:HDOD domain-containing protein [Acidobacteriota bacterium]